MPGVSLEEESAGEGNVWAFSAPETTKPPHFCGGFVLYDAASGVEVLDNDLFFNVYIFIEKLSCPYP